MYLPTISGGGELVPKLSLQVDIENLETEVNIVIKLSSFFLDIRAGRMPNSVGYLDIINTS